MEDLETLDVSDVDAPDDGGVVDTPDDEEDVDSPDVEENDGLKDS